MLPFLLRINPIDSWVSPIRKIITWSACWMEIDLDFEEHFPCVLLMDNKANLDIFRMRSIDYKTVANHQNVRCILKNEFEIVKLMINERQK